MFCRTLSVSVLATLACFVVLGTPGETHAQEFEVCPNPAPNSTQPKISSALLTDVCIPSGFGDNPIRFFDDHSWRAFIALVWPAKTDGRGKPDLTAKLGVPGRALVFETFKSEWEIFQKDGAKPADWEKMGVENPCALGSLSTGDLVLAAFSKFANLGQAGFGDLVGPLIAQNRTYVRFQTAFNEIEFRHILDNDLHLRKNVQNVVFPNGAIDIKAAWIDMERISQPERFYTRKAHVFDLELNSCIEKTVGLVGLHIVHKTPSRPQWIWSTFEHVDNVPPAEVGATAHTFNAKDGVAMPDENPFKYPPALQAPPPFNVSRLKPIDTRTEAINEQYRALLRMNGGPWQFYKLVMTQWPLTPNSPNINGKPPNTFPGKGTDTTAFANVTLETFDQKTIAKGCMNCHDLTRVNSDFLWSLATRAWPPVAAVSGSQPFSGILTRGVPTGQFRNRTMSSEIPVIPTPQLDSIKALRALMETDIEADEGAKK